MSASRWWWRAVVLTLAAVLVAWAPPATAVKPKPRPKPACRAGLVALTFDDGPSPTVTPRLLRILKQRHVPATFFMVGSRVAASPRTARAVARAGFQVANHTWSHARLIMLSDAAVAAQLRRTRAEQRRHGLSPGPLMRPPYGELTPRVRGIIRGLHLVPVLWDVDSNDWRGGDSAQIASRVLRQLRPHASNIVLQHDGVANSPASVGAVPIIVKQARARGFCFTDLTDHGKMRIPTPTLGTRVTVGREAGQVPIRLTLTLDRPTSREVSVRVMTMPGTATAGVDYRSVDTLVRFRTGTTRATVDIPVLDDALHESDETVRIVLTAGRGLRVPTPEVAATIVSDDAAHTGPPALRSFRGEGWTSEAVWRVEIPLR